MKILTAIIASAFAFGLANAQTSVPPTGREGTHAADSETSGENAAEKRKVEDHIKDLRDELKITDAEEPLWSGVADVMRENARDLDRVIDKREASLQTANAVENLDSYAQVVQAHAAAVKRLAGAFSQLYSQMSDSQKKIADVVFSHRHDANGEKLSYNSGAAPASSTKE